MNLARTKGVLLPLVFFLVVVLSPWALIGIAIPPSAQDFPLLDDGIYFRGACSFFHQHEPDYQYWASPAQLGQWLWAMPFLAVLGDSFLAARASTMVLSWLGLGAFFLLLRRQEGVSPRLAGFATACLAWNPLFFLLSGTFMTDVPALSFSLMALLLYAYALDSGRLLLLAAAVLLALTAVATRQNALAVPLTAGVLLLCSEYRTKPLWIAAMVAPVAFFFVLDAWLSKRPDVTVLHARVPDRGDLGWLVFTAAHYLGLLATPVLVLLPPARLGKVFWTALAAMSAGAFWQIAGWTFLNNEGVFPYLGGVFGTAGCFIVVPREGPPVSWYIRLLPTVLGCVGAALLIARAAEQGRRWAARPLVIFALLHLAILVVAPTYFDRYLLPLVPGALVIAAGEAGQPRWKAGLAALALLGGLSVCLMHDGLSWNVARWDLGRRAIAHGIKPTDIEGGPEWNYWYPRYQHTSAGVQPEPWYIRCRYCHYQLSLTPSPFSSANEQAPLDTEPFTQWLLPQKGTMYLLRLPDDRSGDPARPEADEPRKKEQPPEALRPSPSN